MIELVKLNSRLFKFVRCYCCWQKALTRIVVIRRQESEIDSVVSNEGAGKLTLEISASLSLHGGNLTLTKLFYAKF